MKVSIITATYNRGETIGDTLRSLAAQTYDNIEHVIIDGASKDNTHAVIEDLKLPNTIVVSEPDEGIYDAWNKGLKRATGDVIGFLHSDDFYTDDHVVADIVAALASSGADSVFGDIQFVKPEDTSKVTRYYSSAKFHPNRFAKGYMPAHPSFYAKRAVYESVGPFRTDYKIAADFEHMIRTLHTGGHSYAYINQPLVTMRTGGLSTANLNSRMTLIRENVRACHDNDIRTNFAKIIFNRLYKLAELKL